MFEQPRQRQLLTGKFFSDTMRVASLLLSMSKQKLWGKGSFRETDRQTDRERNRDRDLLVRAPDLWSKGCEFVIERFVGRSSGRIFFSSVNFVCWLFLTRCPFQPPRYRSGTLKKKKTVVLPQMQVAGYTLTRIHPWPNEVGVVWLCLCPGIVWETIRRRAHTKLVREQSVTVVSARWATVDWSWPKEWN